MFSKISRSWTLLKASASVLRSDSELMVFPLMSSIAALLVLISFIGPMLLLKGIDPRAAGFEDLSWLGMVWLFAFYLVNYFVVFFFNTALVGAAMIRLDGGNPSIGDGLRIASSRVLSILGYAAVAATVGLLLQMLRQRGGMLGRWVTSLFGMAWSVATFLVVPVLVSRNMGPIAAVKESASLLRKTWGENLIGAGGIGIVGGLLIFATILLGAGLAVLAFVQAAVAVGVIILVLSGLTVIMIGLVQSALAAVYAAVLYRYAAGQSLPANFEPELLQQAFHTR